MKLAIISDTHGNLPALEATLAHVDGWQPDVTVVNGDAVNRGPRSRQCWELLSRRCRDDGWLMVRGNHEDYVAEWTDTQTEHGSPCFEIFRSSFWTFQQLGGLVSELIKLPQQVEVEGPDGSIVRVTHGTMRGNEDGIYVGTPDDELRQKIAPAPAIFCTGHTHRPLVRELNGTLIVNAGSAGTAFDGDPRISYAQLVWERGAWQANIVRLNYDRPQAERDFELTDYLDGGGPLVEIFFQEWLQARPMVNRWARQYEEAVLTQHISLRQSVSAFLSAEK